MEGIRYNVLYGLLAAGKVSSDDPYYKRHIRPPATSVAAELVKLLVPSAATDTGRRGLFASAVCAAVLDTCFGNDIARLDPHNTYEHPVVHGTVGERQTMYDLTGSPKSLRALVPLLDEDIAERLAAPQWIDYMAAGCLQLLREVI